MGSKIAEFGQKINRVKVIGLDSNIFIYQFAEHKTYSPFTNKLFYSIEKGELNAVISLVAYIEIISFPSLKNEPRLLKNYRQIFLKSPNLKMINPDVEIAEKAASLRRNYGLRTPDAITLATAIGSKTDLFITNDESFKKVKEIKTLVLKDFIGG